MDQNPNDISRNTQQTQDAQAGAQQTTQTSQMPPMAGQMPQKAKFDFKKYKLPIIIAAIAVVVIVVADCGVGQCIGRCYTGYQQVLCNQS